MQNFGRGMWRRVGDYERLHSYNNKQLQHYLAFIEYQKLKQRQDAVNLHREQVLKRINSNPPDINKEEIQVEERNNDILIVAVEPEISTQQCILAESNEIPETTIVSETTIVPTEIIDEPIVIIDKEKRQSKNRGKKHKK
jgi:hypothetical protein